MRQHKVAEISEDEASLFVNGVLVYTLKDGFIVHDNAAMPGINTHSSDNGCE